jgi:hypothetical protein
MFLGYSVFAPGSKWLFFFPKVSHLAASNPSFSERFAVTACLSRLSHIYSTISLFARLISHQPAILLSQNKSATNNQPAVLFSQNKPAPAISHQPTEQADALFVLLINHQPAVLFSLFKPAISNQPAVLFSQSKPAPAISHQPNEQAANG